MTLPSDDADLNRRKQNVFRMLVTARTADLIDKLIDQVQQQVPPNQTFTRDDLIELLRGISERMREET
jgi:hypothetical protein